MSMADTMRRAFGSEPEVEPDKPKLPHVTATRMHLRTLKAVCGCGYERNLAHGYTAKALEADRDTIERLVVLVGWQGGKCPKCLETKAKPTAQNSSRKRLPFRLPLGKIRAR